MCMLQYIRNGIFLKKSCLFFSLTQNSKALYCALFLYPPFHMFFLFLHRRNQILMKLISHIMPFLQDPDMEKAAILSLVCIIS